ncbi:metal ABC transporter solute-binding protein, Zn/Mn family [Actinokineospora soli]|uniref:Metal ABC transporter solute-binding protein, Zn/Mn family n=1 Tax=Actinokineospora soli TaxID=1048753 RepID=A0ABW2TFP0_9PSEU
MTRHRRRQATTAAFAAASLLTGLAACAESPQAPTPGASPATVVVTSTNVWASVVKAVGGDHVEVRPILADPAADPHGYEAKPADAVAFDGAKLAVSNGGGYDDFFTGLADAAGGDLKRVVAVEAAEGHEEAEAAPAQPATTTTAPTEDEHGHEHGENEHVWYDLEAVHAVAEQVSTELSAIDPAHAEAFKANTAKFGEGIDALVEKAAAIGAAKPGAKVVATEPVAAYLLETAGLTDVTPPDFAEAVEEESEPSAAARAAAEKLITDKQVAAVVFNDQTATPVTEAVKATAERSGVPVVAMTETLPDGATGYLEWMTTQVDSLAAALAK